MNMMNMNNKNMILISLLLGLASGQALAANTINPATILKGHNAISSSNLIKASSSVNQATQTVKAVKAAAKSSQINQVVEKAEKIEKASEKISEKINTAEELLNQNNQVTNLEIDDYTKKLEEIKQEKLKEYNQQISKKTQEIKENISSVSSNLETNSNGLSAAQILNGMSNNSASQVVENVNKNIKKATDKATEKVTETSKNTVNHVNNAVKNAKKTTEKATEKTDALMNAVNQASTTAKKATSNTTNTSNTSNTNSLINQAVSSGNVAPVTNLTPAQKLEALRIAQQQYNILLGSQSQDRGAVTRLQKNLQDAERKLQDAQSQVDSFRAQLLLIQDENSRKDNELRRAGNNLDQAWKAVYGDSQPSPTQKNK